MMEVSICGIFICYQFFCSCLKKKIRIVIVLGCFNDLREFDAFVCVHLDWFLPAGVIVRAGTTRWDDWHQKSELTSGTKKWSPVSAALNIRGKAGLDSAKATSAFTLLILLCFCWDLGMVLFIYEDERALNTRVKVWCTLRCQGSASLR